MFKQTTLLILAVLILGGSALHLSQGNLNHDVAGKTRVYITADIGKDLAPCMNCGQASLPYSAKVAGSGEGWTWDIEQLPSGKVAISRTGMYDYLHRCNNCWYGAAYPDAAFVKAMDRCNIPSWGQW